jgi:putative heme-binding domain-containing protein
MKALRLRPFLAALVAALPILSLSAAELTLGDRQFTFPDDYTLQVAASPPVVDRPIEASFDERGRLFVTESSGSNESPQEQLKKKPHRVLRLMDGDGDGVFESRTVFAEGLMFPEGCLWKDGALFVAAPPQIWKFIDSDDDGVAEKREVWFDGKTLTGCANDLHGPYAGPDGWIYWCKGAFAEQKYDLPGRPGWTTRASHVFRARPDATGIEPVFTAGMDNPVGVDWTPEGDLIVGGTFVQPGGGHRDALIHAVYGGVWGKAHDVLEGHARTGDLMPPMTHHGPAATCSLTRYGRDLLACQFNMRKVSRHRLEAHGASYRTADSNFLSCDHPDFHPTDVLQAPDGSVLVVDTGGWYKLCCPTSQLAKPNVLGGIYRLRKKGGDVPAACPPSQWTAGDPADTTQQLANLKSSNLHLRRRAAEALGRAHVKAAVPALLEALAAPEVDRFLFHSLTYALLEIGDPPATRVGLASTHSRVQQGALYALAQMPNGALGAAEVITRLEASDEGLRAAALFAVEHRREWAADLVPWIREQLSAAHPNQESLRRVLRTLAAEPLIRELMGAELTRATTRSARETLLGVMAQANRDALPKEWTAPVAKVLASGDDSTLEPVLAVLASSKKKDAAVFEPILAQLGSEQHRPPGARLAALAVRSQHELTDDVFSFVLAQLTADPALANRAASVLAGAKLTNGQLARLVPRIATCGILERTPLLKAFAGSDDVAVGQKLLEALSESGALASLPGETLKETFARFPEEVRRDLESAKARLAPADHRARIDELEKTLAAGNPQHGSVVFQSVKAACATCHTIGYKGGHVGPDLGKIGAIRTRRDLIEAIVFPSASFVRSYEPVQIVKNDDSLVYGIVTNQGTETLTLTTAAATPETRVPRSEIKSLGSGQFSLMPQGMDQVLTPVELADLIAFLQSMK